MPEKAVTGVPQTVEEATEAASRRATKEVSRAHLRTARPSQVGRGREEDQPQLQVQPAEVVQPVAAM